MIRKRVIMINNIVIKSPVDDLGLSVNYIVPNGSIKGLVCVAHGMSEHKERYDYFLKRLADDGYISVCYDHRGHGKSVKVENDLGYFYTEDETAFSKDLYTVIDFFKVRYQASNVILFAHSMGTLVARAFLQTHDDKVNKVILCGPPTKQALVDVGLFLARMNKMFDGDRKPNKLLDSLTFSSFNKKYGEPNLWLSKNRENVTNYNNDSLCGFTFTTNGFINLYKLQKRAFQKNKYAVQNKNLPILLIAGADDAVIGNLKKFKDLELFMKKIGYQDVRAKTYESLRHELLQEVEKETIIDDILSFINE